MIEPPREGPLNRAKVLISGIVKNALRVCLYSGKLCARAASCPWYGSHGTLHSGRRRGPRCTCRSPLVATSLSLWEGRWPCVGGVNAAHRARRMGWHMSEKRALLRVTAYHRQEPARSPPFLRARMQGRRRSRVMARGGIEIALHYAW